jgi:hypothetical protein
MSPSPIHTPSALTIGLATCRKVPDLTPDDRLLASEVRRRGAEVVSVLWDDDSVDWGVFDSLVLRSVWDYHHRVDEFRAWLDRLERARVRVWNPIPMVRWNLHKSYLEELAGAGIPVVPTVRLARGSLADLGALLAEKGWARAVVKPAISASAHETWLLEIAEAGERQARFAALLAERDLLVQRFEPAVRERGEWSLLFFGGVYSHAMLKRPGAGDFRVQEELGGSSTLTEPPEGLVEQAQRILARWSEPPLYARVDGIDLDGTFTLMELELIEPVLFLGSHPQAPARLADALGRLTS